MPTNAKPTSRARPKHPAGRVRRRLASELVRDVRALDRRIAELDERIGVEVETSGTTLTKIFGVGPILAAKIVAIVGNDSISSRAVAATSPIPGMTCE
jgi:transposase